MDVCALWLFSIASKAYEPLSVAIAARSPLPRPPFALILVVCEAIKLSASLFVYYFYSPPPLAKAPRKPRLLSRATIISYGIPALLLAITNLLLGFAVPRLNPIAYQTLSKGIIVLVTAILSACCRQPLSLAQWTSLILLLLGCALALPDAHHAQERIAGDGIATTADAPRC